MSGTCSAAWWRGSTARPRRRRSWSSTPETGRRVAIGRAAHEVTGSAGARESDPDGWWTALREALAETGRAGDIAAISVAAQQHGLVTLDERGRPVRPAVLWNDTRSAPDADALVAAWGPATWADRIGSVPVPSFTVTRWAWLRRTEPARGRADAGDPAAARLPDRAAVRSRGDRPRRRLRHRLVVDGDRGRTCRRCSRLPERRARRGDAARGRRPGRGGRPRAARGAAELGLRRTCSWARGPATTWARRSASASGRASPCSASARRARPTS